MEQHLPALQIVIPMVAAPLCVLLRHRVIVLAFSIAVCWATFAMALMLMGEVLEHGVVVYALGGWERELTDGIQYGIEYRIDVMSSFMLVLVSGIGAIVLTYAPTSMTREIPARQHYLFCAAYLLCMTGLLGITITGDLFNLFVFLEISSLSSYALISLGQRRQAFTAAFQYLIMGTVGATFILIGVGLMYMMTGTLNMADMKTELAGVAAQLASGRGERILLVAFAFLSVGISLKMALFPLHLWLPNAYTFAPSVVTAFLAATATKVSVYVLLRVVFSIYGIRFAFSLLPLDAFLMVLSLIGIFVASTMAIFQTNIKRMLAYSSVAQIGYIALGISFASVSGLTGGIVHLLNHALTKGGLFLAMGCIALRLGSVELNDLRGIATRMPVTMFAWVLGGLGLIGVPVTAGFISKWYLVSAALEKGWWPVAVMLLLCSLLAVIYVWRVVEVAYFQKPEQESADIHEAPLSMLIPTYVLIAATLLFGIWTTMSAGLARQAAQLLLEVAS